MDNYGTCEDVCWKCNGKLKLAKRNGQEPTDSKWTSECVNPNCSQYGSRYAYIEGRSPMFTSPASR